MLDYSFASTKSSLDPVVSDLRTSGTFFFRSSWKSISGPSDALPVDLSIPEISPVLSTLGSSLTWCCIGLGSSAGASSWPKSIKSSCFGCGGGASLMLALGGIERAVFAF